MKNQIFDLFHIAYIIISLTLTFLIVYVTKRHTKTKKQKDTILKIFALLTVFLHISPLWVNFLKDGQAFVIDNMIFPIYFCNIAMYMLLIVAFVEDKQSKTFKYLAIVTSYSAILGSLISLFYPEYYLYDTGLSWGVLKSLLSHSTMLVGGFILMTESYFKVERKNTFTFATSYLGYAFIGVSVNLLFKAFDLPPVNAMYLQKPPIEELPFLNAYVIGALLLLVIFAFTFAYEKIIDYNHEHQKTVKV